MDDLNELNELSFPDWVDFTDLDPVYDRVRYATNDRRITVSDGPSENTRLCRRGHRYTYRTGGCGKCKTIAQAAEYQRKRVVYAATYLCKKAAV